VGIIYKLAMDDFEVAMTSYNVCAVAKVLERLEDQPERRDSLVKHLDISSGTPHTIIEKVLKSWGHPVSNVTIGRHRRKECICVG
jgi:7-keto-8-aminopelargonate synthetase-like enzyme